jgi:hypothetical protein
MTDQVVIIDEEADKEIFNLEEAIRRIKAEHDSVFAEKLRLWSRLFRNEGKIYPPDFVEVVDAYESNYEEAKLKYGRIRDRIRVHERKCAEMSKKHDELSAEATDLQAKLTEYDEKLAQKEKEKLTNAFIRKYSDWNSADLTKHAKDLNQLILFSDGYSTEDMFPEMKTELDVITKFLVERKNIHVKYDADHEISFTHGSTTMVPKRRKL